MQKKITSWSVSEEMLKSLDAHPLVKDVGRSGTLRIAVSEFLRKQVEKEKQNESREKK